VANSSAAAAGGPAGVLEGTPEPGVFEITLDRPAARNGLALATLKASPAEITWERWEALQREYGAKSQLEILADIGVGKRLSFVVAQALTRVAGRGADPSTTAAAANRTGALTLRGVEGVAITLALYGPSAGFVTGLVRLPGSDAVMRPSIQVEPV